MNRIHKLAISVLLLMMCAALHGASAQSTAIKAEDGGGLPDSIYVDETFTVLITEDGSPVGADTNVIFTLPQVGGTHINGQTDDNGKARYKPRITGTLGIKVLDGLVTVAEATVDVTDTAPTPTPTPTPTYRSSGGGGGYSLPATPTVIATAAPTAPPGATSGVTPVVTPVKVVDTPGDVDVRTPASTLKPPKPLKPAKKSVPGFTSVFAIAGLLAALYLVLWRRE